MATNLDNRTATFETANLILQNDEVSTEPWAEALIENAGFAAYLPRNVGAQAAELTATSGDTTVSERRSYYAVAGTYDFYAFMLVSTNLGGTARIETEGTYLINHTGTTTGGVSGSATIVLGTTGWYHSDFTAYYASANCRFSQGAVFARFVDSL